MIQILSPASFSSLSLDINTENKPCHIAKKPDPDLKGGKLLLQSANDGDTFYIV